MKAFACAVMVALATSCAVDDPGDDDDDVASVEQQTTWSGWQVYGDVSLRFCQTATQVSWQFANNPYRWVQTWGDGMSAITTNIAGVPSGSKYRTRTPGTYNFFLKFGYTSGPADGWNLEMYKDLSQVPHC